MPPERAWRDASTLVDIYNAACLVVQRTTGITLDAFLDDIEKQDLVVLRIMVMGEATKRLSTSFRSEHPEIPWKDIAGMRDVLVHGYDRWNLPEVWTVATTFVPQLVQQLEPLLPPRGDAD